MKELTKSFALSPRGPALPVHRDSRAAPALASLAVDASSPEEWRLHGRCKTVEASASNSARAGSSHARLLANRVGRRGLS